MSDVRNHKYEYAPSYLLAVKFVIALQTEVQFSVTTCCYCHLLFSLQLLRVFDK